MWTFNKNISLDYVPPINDFDPIDLNTDTWLQAAVAFKAKYAVLTAVRRICIIFAPDTQCT